MKVSGEEIFLFIRILFVFLRDYNFMSYEEIIYPIGFINQQLVHLRSDEQEQGES